MVTYDLQPIQDYFKNSSTPTDLAFMLYRLISNYAKSVGSENFEQMQYDICILSQFVECIESVSEFKNQTPKVLEGK